MKLELSSNVLPNMQQLARIIIPPPPALLPDYRVSQIMCRVCLNTQNIAQFCWEPCTNCKPKMKVECVKLVQDVSTL